MFFSVPKVIYVHILYVDIVYSERFIFIIGPLKRVPQFRLICDMKESDLFKLEDVNIKNYLLLHFPAVKITKITTTSLKRSRAFTARVILKDSGLFPTLV